MLMTLCVCVCIDGIPQTIIVTMLDTLWPDDVRRTLTAISVRNGPTDYIDQVESSDLDGVAACTFTDPHMRRGVAMRVHVSHCGMLIDEGIYTVFERCSREETVLVMCRSHTGGGSRPVTDASNEFGYWRYHFHSIVDAHTRVTPYGAGVLAELLRNRVYCTRDGYMHECAYVHTCLSLSIYTYIYIYI
jgi:hypothetical protein